MDWRWTQLNRYLPNYMQNTHTHTFRRTIRTFFPKRPRVENEHLDIWMITSLMFYTHLFVFMVCEGGAALFEQIALNWRSLTNSQIALILVFCLWSNHNIMIAICHLAIGVGCGVSVCRAVGGSSGWKHINCLQRCENVPPEPQTRGNIYNMNPLWTFLHF